MNPPELQHVYVIEDENHVIKIGIAANPNRRIAALAQSTAYEIVNRYESPACTNAQAIEKAAHKHFIAQRKKGEWFTVPFDDAVDYVQSHFNQLPAVINGPEVERDFEGFAIRQRADGYFDATAMCQATCKRWPDYRRLYSTQEFLDELSLEKAIPVVQILTTEQNQGLIQTIQGGTPEKQGTWIHPQVAINLAQWCSPKFAVQVSKWVFELMDKGSVSLKAQPRLTSELETYIDARISDGIRNALAKPKLLSAPEVKELTPAERIADKLLVKLRKWVADGKGDSITNRDLKHLIRSKGDTKYVDDAIGVLVDFGYLFEQTIYPKKGGKPKKVYIIHPSICE